MVIKLTLYFKRGQCIELSPQQGAVAWPVSASWHSYGAWQRNPSSGCCHVCRFWQAWAGRESWVFMTSVPGRTILLRQDLLTQCHPLPPTVHMAMASLSPTSEWRVNSVPCYWTDRSAGGRMRCQHGIWRRVRGYRSVRGNIFMTTKLNKLKEQFCKFSGMICHYKSFHYKNYIRLKKLAVCMFRLFREMLLGFVMDSSSSSHSFFSQLISIPYLCKHLMNSQTSTQLVECVSHVQRPFPCCSSPWFMSPHPTPPALREKCPAQKTRTSQKKIMEKCIIFPFSLLRKYNIRVEDIMVRDVRYITLNCCYRDLQNVLLTGHLKTLALVESAGETHTNKHAHIKWREGDALLVNSKNFRN